MASLFGAGSRSSSYSTKSVLGQTPASPGAAPTDPLPAGQTKPSDILLNRLHEVKRITKSLASYLDGSDERKNALLTLAEDLAGISSCYSSHSANLIKLSAPGVITTPLAESSLFIPAQVGKGTAQGGWADLLQQIKDGNKQTADDQANFAKVVAKDVVVPMKKLRTDIKAHISQLEKEVSKLSDAVSKERESSATTLLALAKGIATSNVPLQGVPPSPADDPVLLRAAADTQMAAQIVKENELLKAVQSWQDKTETFEKEIFAKVNSLWRTYEAAHSNMLLENQQRSVFLSANVDSVEPHAEWQHFAGLNHLIPASTEPRSNEHIEYPHRDDPLTIPLKEGLLDRQKKFIKTWQSAFWVLTPSGHLHSYPDSSAPLSKPQLSIALSGCSLGPLPSPEAAVKGRTAEPTFTLETPDGKQVLRAKSLEELAAWHVRMSTFTQRVDLPPLPAHDEDDAAGDLGGARADDHAAAHSLPPPVPPRSPPALPPRDAAVVTDAVVEPSSVALPMSPDVPQVESAVTSPILTEATEEPEAPDYGGGEGDLGSGGGDIGQAVEENVAGDKE